MRLRTPTDIGLLIRERRRALRLDQAELARRVGVSRQWIIGMERGKGRADLSLVLRTLDALGVVLRGEEPSLPDLRRSSSVPIPNVDEILAAHRTAVPSPATERISGPRGHAAAKRRSGGGRTR